MALEPHQISTEEVPDLVKAHLHCIIACNLEHSIRGRPHSRGNQYHQYNRQSSPLPRYSQQLQMSEACFHPNRYYSNTHYHINGEHHSPRPVRNIPNTSIALCKLQGPPLKSASYLESKETNSGNTLVWSSLKKHLTSKYSEIPYHTHAINAFDSLFQGSDESTIAYLHRVEDILECIHHTSDMSFYYCYRH